MRFMLYFVDRNFFMPYHEFISTQRQITQPILFSAKELYYPLS